MLWHPPSGYRVHRSCTLQRGSTPFILLIDIYIYIYIYIYYFILLFSFIPCKHHHTDWPEIPQTALRLPWVTSLIKLLILFFINSRGFCHISVRDYFPRFEGCLTYGQPSCSCPVLIYEYQQDHSRRHRTNCWEIPHLDAATGQTTAMEWLGMALRRWIVRFQR